MGADIPMTRPVWIMASLQRTTGSGEDSMRALYLVMVLAIVGSACGGVTPRLAPATDDQTIATRVRTALLNDPVVHGNEITVMAQNGIVILQGQVHGQEEANAAIVIARRIEGVKDVKSELRTDR